MKTYDPVTETCIETAGVMRCCLASVAGEHIGTPVALGTKSACQHCKLPFTLIIQKHGQKPRWTPDWIIAKEFSHE